MRRLISTLLFLIIAYHSNSQIRINHTFFDPCNDSIESVSYELLGPDYKIYVHDSSGMNIKKSGHYLLLVALKRGNYYVGWSEAMRYDEDRIYSDTLILPRLLKEEKALHDSNPRSFFRYCEETANGLIIDYYPNGKKRMEGTFKEGIPVSNLKYYNKDGQLIRTDIYKTGIYKPKRSCQNKLRTTPAFMQLGRQNIAHQHLEFLSTVVIWPDLKSYRQARRREFYSPTA